ncbi:MAG: ATP:cob(I)alamin adenosyltransferase, partial [Paenibacillus sp. RIFOXYA1_FULL_44_5]
MKLYTRTGDEGKTSLIGGRTNKNDIRVEAYGTVDELNSFVGYAISLMNEIQELQDLQTDLTTIQHELFDLGSDLALYKRELMEYKVNADMVDNLERWIDRYEQENPPITRFILPGGSVQASALHVCRTVCRRAERLVVTLGQTAEINRETRK